MLRILGTALVGVLLSVLLLACGEKKNPEGDVPSDNPGQGGVDGGGSTCTTGKVSYSQTIKPLLEQYCTACHSASGTSPALDTYADAVANAKASNEAIQTGTMPLGGTALTDAQKKAFQDWVDQGTPNN